MQNYLRPHTAPSEPLSARPKTFLREKLLGGTSKTMFTIAFSLAALHLATSKLYAQDSANPITIGVNGWKASVNLFFPDRRFHYLVHTSADNQATVIRLDSSDVGQQVKTLDFPLSPLKQTRLYATQVRPGATRGQLQISYKLDTLLTPQVGGVSSAFTQAFYEDSAYQKKALILASCADIINKLPSMENKIKIVLRSTDSTGHPFNYTFEDNTVRVYAPFTRQISAQQAQSIMLQLCLSAYLLYGIENQRRYEMVDSLYDLHSQAKITEDARQAARDLIFIFLPLAHRSRELADFHMEGNTMQMLYGLYPLAILKMTYEAEDFLLSLKLCNPAIAKKAISLATMFISSMPQDDIWIDPEVRAELEKTN